MKSTYRPWLGLACLWLSGFFLLQAAPAQSQIQTIQKPRPAILGFGRPDCPMCVFMERTLGQLKAKYGDRIDIRMLHYDPEAKLFKQYKVVLVPTQVFLDAAGREVFRQTGIFTLFELEKKLKQLKLLQTP